MKKPWLIALAVIVVVGLSLMNGYNNLVTLNQSVDRQWAQVATQYQRRFDLIPNLVASVEAVMKQEQKVFSDLAAARSRYSGSRTVDEKSQAATEVESAFSRLLVVMENYPQLKSNENATQLMDELAGTENRVAVERQRFNQAVSDYNLATKRLPGSLLASLFGFRERTFFQAAPESSAAPAVKFNVD